MIYTYVLTGVILVLIFLISFFLVKIMYDSIKKGDLITLKLMCFCTAVWLNDSFLKLLTYVMGKLL